jgi:hypothetical protein
MQTSNGTLFMRDNMYKKFMESINSDINVNIPCNAYIMESILPKYIVDIIGGGKINNKTSEDESDNYYYRYKTIICDDFIESLLAFESFNKQIMEFRNNKMINEWCQKKCINIGSLSSIYDIRERIMDDLLNAGIDIFYNSEHRLIDQSINNFIPTIINIKRCIYEGLRHNLLTYDDEEKTYKTLQNIPVDIENSILSIQLQNKLRSMKILLGDIQPKYIITDHINLSMKKDNTILYNVTANYISILDGYIYPDTTFGGPIYTDEKILESTDDNDPSHKIETYNRLVKASNSDIQIPVCKLTNINSIFGNNIINNIINPICK